MREAKHLPSWIALLVCLAAWGLRLGPLWANRFHSDEALYATWALEIASGRDVLLASAAPDKPPLLFYTMAAAFLALGHIEVAARLAGLMAGVLSVALVWRLASNVSVLADAAAAAMAFSPFAVLFSPTAFLDPVMVMFVLASLTAVTRGRSGWSGVLLGLAAAVKVQALIFAPLVVACGFIFCRLPRKASLHHLLIGLAIPLCTVLMWDRLRGGVPFWVQQTLNYGGIRFIYANQVLPRLVSWGGFLPYFFGRPMLIVLAVGLPLLLIYDLTRSARTRTAALDLILIAFALGYFFLHWLLAFPVWDRYLLGLGPVLCMVIGRMADLGRQALYRFVSPTRLSDIIITGLMLALLIGPAVQASRSEIPVGGDHGPHDGLDRVAALLSKLPYGSVVYDHWLGWSLRYYLWDARAYIAYFATPEALTEDLHVFGRTSPRYIVFPADESITRIARAIAAEGFGFVPVLYTQDRHGRLTFTVYRIDSYVAP